MLVFFFLSFDFFLHKKQTYIWYLYLTIQIHFFLSSYLWW